MSRTQKQPKEDEEVYELTPRGVISTIIDDVLAGVIVDALELHARRREAGSGEVGAIIFDEAGGRFELVRLNTHG